jgi:hypothetical protein
VIRGTIWLDMIYYNRLLSVSFGVTRFQYFSSYFFNFFFLLSFFFRDKKLYGGIEHQPIEALAIAS